MSARGVPRTGLYLFCTACGLFATGYGALDLVPAPGMAFLLGWGPAIAVAWWLSEDCKRTRTVDAFDSGLFFYLTWPLTLPWYALRTRGRAGWALAAQLYGLALVGSLGFIWGATLRFFIVS
jgi:hypothetical protein